MGKIKDWWARIKNSIKSSLRALRSFFVLLFASFVFPIVQLFIILCSTKPASMDVNSFVIVFVAIASFLTSFFFVSSFWKQDRVLARIMLVASYIISLVLFVSCRLQVIFEIPFFSDNIYKWGVIIALLFAIVVGFITKIDEQITDATIIAEQARDIHQGSYNGKKIKL